VRRIVIGFLAVITAGSVLIMTGTGAASAATMTSTNAATLQSLHDTMASQWQAGDMAGLSATQSDLAGELTTLRTPTGHAAMAPGRADTLTETRQRNDDVGTRLAALAPTAAPTAAPPDLSGLAAAIQNLLSTLMALVQSLLGAVPAPAPAS
jgi:hypothetical protein